MPAPFIAVNLLLSFTAIVANTLILVALGKVSSIRAPTKLLFRFLAMIDLCVGLVSQPLGAVLDLQQIIEVKFNVIREIHRAHTISTFVLSEISIVISTLISIDRVLALSLGWKYRHVTVKRVRTLLICLFCTRFVLTVPCFIPQDYLNYFPIFYTFFTLHVRCIAHFRFLLREDIFETQGRPNSSTKYRITRPNRRNFTKRNTIQGDSFKYRMDTAGFASLLSSFRNFMCWSHGTGVRIQC